MTYRLNDILTNRQTGTVRHRPTLPNTARHVPSTTQHSQAPPGTTQHHTTPPAPRSLEIQNEDQKSRNVGRSLLNALGFTKVLNALSHIHRRYRAATGSAEPASDGYRLAMVNEIDVLVADFFSSYGSDLVTRTSFNLHWHTGLPHNMRQSTDVRRSRLWEWIWRVAMGVSLGERAGNREHWAVWLRRHIREHMFHK